MIKQSVKNIIQQGGIGEQIARRIIKKVFKPTKILQIDWMIEYKGDWISIEVKHKPFFSFNRVNWSGLGIGQVITRMKLYEDKGIRCLLLCIDSNTKEVYGQWLDILEKSNYADLKSKIRVYDQKEFKNLGNYENIVGETLKEIIDKAYGGVD